MSKNDPPMTEWCVWAGQLDEIVVTLREMVAIMRTKSWPLKSTETITTGSSVVVTVPAPVEVQNKAQLLEKPKLEEKPVSQEKTEDALYTSLKVMGLSDKLAGDLALLKDEAQNLDLAKEVRIFALEKLGPAGLENAKAKHGIAKGVCPTAAQLRRVVFECTATAAVVEKDPWA